MELVENIKDGVTVIEVRGRLDNDTTADLEAKVTPWMEKQGGKLVVDLSGLDYINSSGLRILVMAYQRLNRSGGKFAVTGIKDYILEVFEIAGYHKLFMLFPTQDEAIEAF